MPEEFQLFDSYEDNIMNYLTQIENESDDALDMLTNKNTKFLFYQFNQYLAQIGQPLKLTRHTVIADDNYALTTIHEKKMAVLYRTFARTKLSNNRRGANNFG